MIERHVPRRAVSSPEDTSASERQEEGVSAEVTELRGSADRPSALSGTDPESESDDGYELPIDRVFELLKNSRRRETLRYLDDHDGEASLSEVAEHIAAVENDTTPRAITSQQRKRVYVGLYQSHLPKMDDAAVIEFEKNRGTIERGPNAAQLEPYLEVPDDRQWYRLYLGVALGSVLLALAAVGGVGPIRSMPVVVGCLPLLGLAVVTAAQFAVDYR